MRKMKAVQVSRAGGDLEVVERDIPETGPGQTSQDSSSGMRCMPQCCIHERRPVSRVMVHIELPRVKKRPASDDKTHRVMRIRAVLFLSVLTGGASSLLAASGPFFMPNRGQTAAPILYTMQSPEFMAGFEAEGVQFEIHGSTVSLHFGGAQRPYVEPAKQLPGIVNFFPGSDSHGWRTGIHTYESLVYRELYAGIDAVYDSSGGALKCEFRIAPHADPSLIQLVYRGMDGIGIDAKGGLVITTKSGALREAAPEAYQFIAGVRRSVPSSFRLEMNHTVVFDIGAYDDSQPLIIDPLISSIYFGGSGMDVATGVATDAAGDIYVAGWTDSVDWPGGRIGVASGVHVFVAKFQADGHTPVYCTFLGGSGDSRAFGLAVDAAGNAYITGATYSTDFPLSKPLQSRLDGTTDAFVAKLNPAGDTLLFSTYFGGDGSESGNAIALDTLGNIYIAGETTSLSGFPAVNAYQSHSNGGSDAFVMKLDNTGATMLYSTYLGGTRDDRARAIAVNAAGEAYVAGDTNSSDFPVLNAFQAKTGGNQDAFVLKLNASGAGLIYSSYLGGSGGVTGFPESAFAIAVDGSGNAYVTGTTSSTDFPLANASQAIFGGGNLDAFVANIGSTGKLIYSTYLGGNSSDVANAIAVGSSGVVYVTGYTASTDFPGAAATQTTNAGLYDAVVTQLQDGSIVQSTYLGGSNIDAANAIALSSPSDVYVAGQTASGDFPVIGVSGMLPVRLIDAFLVHMSAAPSIFEDGGVAISVGGEVKLSGVISQGCTPIGETWTLTRVEQNLIHQIAQPPRLRGARRDRSKTFARRPAEGARQSFHRPRRQRIPRGFSSRRFSREQFDRRRPEFRRAGRRRAAARGADHAVSPARRGGRERGHGRTARPREGKNRRRDDLRRLPLLLQRAREKSFRPAEP